MIVALSGQKGGSGKTTCAVSLACEWLARGRRVLLVDADPQASARTFADIAAEAELEAPTVVAMGAGLHRPDQLPALASSYDVTVIDCPPRHGEIQRAALMVADVAVLPCGPAPVDAWALAETLDMVQAAQTVRPGLRAVIVVTRRMARTSLGAGAREALADCGVPVLAAELGYRVAYQEAPATGQGVTVYAPRSAAADEVRALATEIEAVAKRRGRK